MSWKEITIGELGKVITGNTPPKSNPEFYSNAYKFIKPTDMEIGNRYTPITEDYYSELAYQKYFNSLIPPLSTCVVTIGSIGKKMTLTDNHCFINQAVNAVITNKDKYDPFFVFYALKNILHKVKTADTGASSGRENVSKSNFMSLKLEVPKNKETQEKIGRILASFDDAIENNLKRIKLLEETAQNIYKEWFVHFRFPNYEHTAFDAISGLPVGWEKEPLNNYVDFREGPGLRNWQFKDEGVPFLNIRMMGDGDLDFSSVKYLDASETETKYKHFLLSEYDHILSTSGTLGKVVTIRESHLPLCLNTSIIRMRPLKPEIGKWQLREMLKSYNFYNEMKSFATGSAQLNFGPKHLNKMILTVPSKSIGVDFENIINPIELQICSLLENNQKLKEARDILLPRLMNRTIEV